MAEQYDNPQNGTNGDLIGVSLFKNVSFDRLVLIALLGVQLYSLNRSDSKPNQSMRIPASIETRVSTLENSHKWAISWSNKMDNKIDKLDDKIENFRKELINLIRNLK